jgi:hypothetical protein
MQQRNPFDKVLSSGMSVAPVWSGYTQNPMKTEKTRENNAPGAGAAVVDGELTSLPQVEHILKALTKLIHGRKLYAENNPRLAEFAREFDTALKSYFRNEDILVLGIDQNVITWHGETVYENEKRDESIAFLLHRDGVGEITIDEKAIGKETEYLVQILTDEYHNLQSDEDVVTKFWNADFEHISYRVLDDYLSVEYGETRPGEGDAPDPGSVDHPEMLPSLEDKGRVIVQRSDPLESIDSYLKKLILRTCTSSDAAEQEAYFQSMVGSFFTVSNEELSMYQDEFAKEMCSDGLAAFIEAVFVFTLMQDNPSAVRDVSGVIERFVDYAVADLDPHTLGMILSFVHDFRKEHTLQDNIEDFCDRIEAKVTEDTVVQSLGEKLKFWNKDSEDILDYFTAVGPAVVDPLLKVLHNVEGDKLHKEICDALISVSGAEVMNVIEKLDVDKPEVAYDAVYIANKIGMKKMSPKIQELLFYPDLAVKEEMINLVARIDDPSSVDLLLGAMADESKQIRLHAMEAAAGRKDSRVLERVGELAFGKELSDRAADEQEAVFKVLGQLGNAGTVEALKKFVEKKSLMNFGGFGKNRENKFLVIRALENIKSPASLNLLKKLADDSNDLVKSRAQRSYDALSKTMREERGRRPSGEDER